MNDDIKGTPLMKSSERTSHSAPCSGEYWKDHGGVGGGSVIERVESKEMKKKKEERKKWGRLFSVWP